MQWTVHPTARTILWYKKTFTRNREEAERDGHLFCGANCAQRQVFSVAQGAADVGQSSGTDTRLRPQMLGTPITRHTVPGRDVAKTTVAWLMDQVRGISGLPLASRKVMTSEALAGTYPSIDRADFRHSFRVSEDIPNDGIELPHRPINTFHLLLDSR